jgi:hypothetical protein
VFIAVGTPSRHGDGHADLWSAISLLPRQNVSPPVLMLAGAVVLLDVGAPIFLAGAAWLERSVLSDPQIPNVRAPFDSITFSGWPISRGNFVAARDNEVALTDFIATPRKPDD